MDSKNKKKLLLILFGIAILTIAYFQNEKEISLSRNKAITIGKVTELNTCSKSTKKCIQFEYLVNNNWIKGSDRGNSFWPKHVRDGNPQIGNYYPVEYDKTNIEYSKIMITKKPLTKIQVEKYLN